MKVTFAKLTKLFATTGPKKDVWQRKEEGEEIEIVVTGLGLETELRLGLPGGGRGGDEVEMNEIKRVFSDVSSAGGSNGEEEGKLEAVGSKNQVVGWPPVAAYRRKNNFGWTKM
ncbi:Auxin-responsive protein IAA19 [Striga hermonthica]|uniref:Auxin-responsive protein n=1 Tax=Striga hermonthica TaxID=68872 RepID=A0A9N7NYR0_STRHE|nr:Auxin-responsive protein IAA19 [Striga hermonthica]